MVERGMRLPLTPSFISNHMNFGLLKDRFTEQLARWDTERCFCKNKFRFIVVKKSRRPMKPHETYFEKVKNDVYAPWKVNCLVGVIPTPRKNMSSSDWIILPTIGENHPFMFQTTKQLYTSLFHMIFHHISTIFHHIQPVINRSFSHISTIFPPYSAHQTVISPMMASLRRLPYGIIRAQRCDRSISIRAMVITMANCSS
jgi:hypothetical protein